MQKTPTTFFRTMKQNLHFVSPDSELWVTKREQNDDTRLKSFELQTIRK